MGPLYLDFRQTSRFQAVVPAFRGVTTTVTSLLHSMYRFPISFSFRFPAKINGLNVHHRFGIWFSADAVRTLEKIDHVLLRRRKGQTAHTEHPRVNRRDGHAVCTDPSPAYSMAKSPLPGHPDAPDVLSNKQEKPKKFRCIPISSAQQLQCSAQPNSKHVDRLETYDIPNWVMRSNHLKKYMMIFSIERIPRLPRIIGIPFYFKAGHPSYPSVEPNSFD